MSNSNSLEDKRRMDNKIRAGCCGCFLGVVVLLFVFIFIGVIVSGSGDVYEGSRGDLTAEEVNEWDKLYTDNLAEFGVVVDSENRVSNDLDDVVKKVSESDVELIDKVFAMSAYGNFTSVYYIEEDQSVISEYVRTLKEDVESGLLEESINDEQFILKRAYMTAVVQNAIPLKERNENLMNIKDFMLDYFQVLKAQARDDGDRVQSNLDQLNKMVDEIVVPVVEE